MCQYIKRHNLRFTPRYIDLLLLLINQFFFILLSWFIIFIMKKLSIDVTEKQYYLLSRIAKSDDRRLQDLLYLIFSQGLSSYFCERSIYIDKDENEFTNEEKEQIKKNKEIIESNFKFWHLQDDDQKKLGYKKIEQAYSNCYNQEEKDFIEKLADEIKQNALKQINIDNQKIKEEIIKEDTAYKIDSEV